MQPHRGSLGFCWRARSCTGHNSLVIRKLHIFRNKQRYFDLAGFGELLVLYRADSPPRLTAAQRNIHVACSEGYPLQRNAARLAWSVYCADRTHLS